MNKSKAAVVANKVLGRVLSIVGWIVSLTMAMTVIVMLTDKEMFNEDGTPFVLIAIIIILFFLTPGVFAIIVGTQLVNLVARFKIYVGLISVQRMTRIDDIAASTLKPVDYVYKDLQKMIKKKFFTNAHIDYVAGEIAVGDVGYFDYSAAPAPWTPPAQQQGRETFRCYGCGAIGTKPRGAPGICEYCGSSN